MKNIIILLLVLNRIFALDFFPDSNTTNTSNTFVIDPKNDPNSKRSFIKYDVNTSIGTDLNATLIDNLANKLGVYKLNKELNVSNPEDLKGYVNAIKLNLPSSGNTIASQLKSKVGDFNSKDRSTYSKEAIIAADENSTEAKVIKTMEDFYTNARSRLANLKTIECYVTRKLVNSYYCPLPSMSNSFFKGGNFRDGKDEAKKSCEGLCVEDSSCLSKDMNKDKIVEEEYRDYTVEQNSSIIINSDIGMMGKLISLEFDNTYKYDANITVDSNDYNETMAIEELNSSNHNINFDVSYFDENSQEYKKFLISKKLKIKDIRSNVTIYLDVIKSNKYKIDFYDSYVFDGNSSIHDDKLTVKLTKSKLEYVDNKFWFCSATHFVETQAQCNGELKTVVIGSSSYKVCVTDGAKQREPEYGAYYTESQCQSRCKLRADCIPTYKHLTSFDPLNLPSDLRDIEIGCVDSPSNTSCTKSICEQLYTEDKMPLIEKSWTNDDDIKITVANGIQQSGLVRPRIDVAGGLSANGDTELRKQTSLREMSEISYANMIETNTYDVSKLAIKEAIPKKNGYDKVDLDTGYSIYWKLKPNSFDIDDNKTYNLYNIIEIDTQYRPIYGTFNTETGVQSGKNDSNILIIDKVYLLKTSLGFKIIKRINYAQGRFKRTTCKDEIVDGVTQNICTESYTWGNIDAYKTNINKTYLSGNYVDYDLNSSAEYFNSISFSSNKKYEKFLAFNSLEALTLIPGVLFNSQGSVNHGAGLKRVYTGDKSITEQSIMTNVTLYGMYSDSSLTYEQLLNYVNINNGIYSTNTQFNKNIIDDGYYNNNKVKFYIAGKPSNMSVNIDFAPDSKEEGKKTFIFMLLYEE